MRSVISHRRRSRAAVVGVGAIALSLVSASAGAAVISGDDPMALATAMAGTATVTGATLAVDYSCVADDGATPADEGVCPTGVGASPMAGFPTNGPTFAIITSGNAALADDPNADGGSGEDWGIDATTIGPGVYDHQIVRVDLGAATGNCLASTSSSSPRSTPSSSTPATTTRSSPSSTLVGHRRPGHTDGQCARQLRRRCR